MWMVQAVDWMRRVQSPTCKGAEREGRAPCIKLIAANVFYKFRGKTTTLIQVVSHFVELLLGAAMGVGPWGGGVFLLWLWSAQRCKSLRLGVRQNLAQKVQGRGGHVMQNCSTKIDCRPRGSSFMTPDLKGFSQRRS